MYNRTLSTCLVVIFLVTILAACASAATPAPAATLAPGEVTVAPQPTEMPLCPDEWPEPELCQEDMALGDLTPLQFTEPQQEGDIWFSEAAYTNPQSESFSIRAIGASEQGIREYVGYSLFSINASELSNELIELDKGVLSDTMRRSWNSSAPPQYQLSESASKNVIVSKVADANRWRITDKTADHTMEYLVVLNVSGEVSVYAFEDPVRACFDLMYKDCRVDSKPEDYVESEEQIKGDDVVVWIQPQIDSSQEASQEASFFDYVIDPKISPRVTHYYPTKTGTKAYVGISVKDGSGSVRAGLCQGTSTNLIDYKDVDKLATPSATIQNNYGTSVRYSAAVKGLGTRNRYRISNRSGWVGWYADYYATSGWGKKVTCTLPK